MATTAIAIDNFNTEFLKFTASPYSSYARQKYTTWRPALRFQGPFVGTFLLFFDQEPAILIAESAPLGRKILYTPEAIKFIILHNMHFLASMNPVSLQPNEKKSHSSWGIPA
jgi:hypothetical protein